MNAPHTLFPQVPPSSTGPAMGQSHIHESARAQVAGAAHYIDDLPEVKGTLHAAPILSPVAHGRLNGVDCAAARAMPGVRAVVLARDIPGDPILAAFAHDEPIFAQDAVHYAGQVIGLVVADTVLQARRAARHVLDAEVGQLVLADPQFVDQSFTHAAGPSSVASVASASPGASDPSEHSVAAAGSGVAASAAATTGTIKNRTTRTRRRSS